MPARANESEVGKLIGRVLDGGSPDKVWERALVENRGSELAKKMGLDDDDIANEDYYRSGIAKMHAVTIVRSNAEAKKKLEKAGYELAKKQPSDSRTYATFEKKTA